MNVFVSVGTQLPFERMLNMVEQVFSGIDCSLFYQVGPSDFKTKKGSLYNYLDQDSYTSLFNDCDVFISHAGVGSIITALENSKSIIIVPRLFSLGEHRNDHQVATANKFKSHNLVRVANDAEELRRCLNEICSGSVSSKSILAGPDPELIVFLRDVINK